MPLSLAEISAHPASATVISLPAPAHKGKASVAAGRRGGPFDIAYEIYGEGPVKLVWIMGMNASKIAWHRQSRYFGVDRGHIYSSLVFDNRGVGDSDKPKTRYSTSEMARDLLEVLQHVGWTGERSIHLTGVSMGGMIAMEFALLAPTLLASLTLQSTAASLNNPLPWYTNLLNRLIMFLPKPLPLRLSHAQAALFSPAFLASPDPSGTFPTNADRFVAEELWRIAHVPQPPWLCSLLQGLAVSSHFFGGERLGMLGDLVGVGGGEQQGVGGGQGLGAPVMVYTGTRDMLIEYTHSHEIVAGLGGEGGGRVRLRVFEGSGHVVHWENLEEYNGMQEALFREAGEAIGGGGGVPLVGGE